MATLNINRKVEDAFYRYKMPKLLAKVEGNGNGIKTVVPNMVEIARALSRPPSYPTKYFGCELGAQVQMDEKAERFIVNGCHDAGKLQTLLFDFIDKFVLCSECGNPETHLKVKKKGKKDAVIEQKCVACGHQTAINSQHKLSTFIVNNPPTEGAEEAVKSKAEKKAGKKGEEAPSSIDLPAASVRTNAAERASGAVAAVAAASSPSTGGGEGDDEDWSEDVSEAAVRERQAAALSSKAAALAMTAELERPVEERLEMFHAFVQARAGSAGFSAREVLAEAERLDCKEKGILSLTTLLLDSDAVAARIEAHKKLLQRFTLDSPKAQKYFLYGLEPILAARPGQLAKLTAILHKIYEEDLVEEEVFFAWAEKPSSKYTSKDKSQKIHEAAGPFLKWLKEAEEEESEEEDEDEGGIAFDASGAAPAAAAADAEKEDEKEEEEEDLDIDAL